MQGLKRNVWIALMGLGYLFPAILSGCGEPVSTPPPPVISISFNGGSSQTIVQGQSVTITANISNDSSGKGVTWKLSGAGTLGNETSASTKYDAPASVASDTTATITATAVADPTRSALYTVNLAAIVVTVSPPSVTTVANTTQQFMATVQNDSSNAGVMWSISPPSGAGTLSNATNTSVSYTAPASSPANDLAVTITATSVATTSISASANVTVPAITVSTNPSGGTVEAGTTMAVTAVVDNDPSNSGVMWSISPSPGAGTLSDVTTTSVTYHAPADAPVSNLMVTLTATSVADNSKTGSTNITVPAITVSAVSPGSALMPVNATQQFAATVNYDPSGKGVTWSPMQGGASCGATCGTFAPSSTDSGATTTYTAPATVPASAAVAITATSVTDTTKSGAAAITLTNGTVKLVPASLGFGVVKNGMKRTMRVALTNTGTTVLTISSVDTSGSFSQTNDCGASVGAGVSCTITVTFPGSTGSHSGTLSISDSSADSPQVVSLSGGLSSLPGPGHISGIGTARIAGTVPSALAVERNAAAPSPTGSSAIGTRVMELVDSTRDDPFAANGSKRELMVRFWYPAELHEECKPAEYASPAVWSYFSQLVGMPLPDVRTNSCQDAPIANGAHPIVVFTPGYTATFTDYTFLFEDLASRGYVVAALDHTYEATVTEFPDGRLVKSLFGSHLGGTLRTDEDAYTSAVVARLSDLKFVLRELDRLNGTAKGPFAGKLDMSRVAVAGHSLGGLTALLGVEQEPRFRAGIILDGVAPDRAVGATVTPVFLLIAGREQWSVDECSLWSNLHAPRLAVKLPNADHLAPSDAVWLAPGLAKTGAMGPEKTVEVLRNYIATFLDANLRGQPVNTLLTGQSPEYPEVVVTTKEQSLCGEP